MGEADDGQAEANDLSVGEEADRSGTESTVGEGQARSPITTSKASRGSSGYFTLALTVCSSLRTASMQKVPKSCVK
jgi:hypothetical protein